MADSPNEHYVELLVLGGIVLVSTCLFRFFEGEEYLKNWKVRVVSRLKKVGSLFFLKRFGFGLFDVNQYKGDTPARFFKKTFSRFYVDYSSTTGGSGPFRVRHMLRIVGEGRESRENGVRSRLPFQVPRRVDGCPDDLSGKSVSDE